MRAASKHQTLTATTVMVGRVPNISHNYQSKHQLKLVWGGGYIFPLNSF